MKLKRRDKMIITLFVLCTVVVCLVLFFRQKKFGSTPTGYRKEVVQSSPNYNSGRFQNQSHTPQFTGDKSVFALMSDLFFGKFYRLKPTSEIPVIKTDLLSLPLEQDVLVWFGHSSYLIQIDGKRILVDPVMSGAASPVSFINKPFKGSDFYSTKDVPPIDYLFISHDHWDHLDYSTVQSLKSRTSNIICGLGVGAHFERWQFNQNKVFEMDWNDSISLDTGFTIHCLPARHFSGRGLYPNQSLWASFLIETPTMKIYVGGDSGYDKHFAEIGERFEKIDLAILENGQYNSEWKYIHMMPEEVVQAAKDLNAEALFPVHSSKYALAKHPWDEPLKKVSQAALKVGYRTLTPMIGELVHLKDCTQQFSEWWLYID